MVVTFEGHHVAGMEHTFPILEEDSRNLDALRPQLRKPLPGHRKQTMWTVIGLLMTVGGYFIRRRIGRRLRRRW